ncbi:MAG: glyoxalase [Marinilabiliales bacterium]|nr:MAG: glyoxalase [Marinilabiliales bacterium]
MAKIISGIQQMGVGIPNVYEAWKWYRENFGADIRIFDEAAEAGLMLPYTGGQPRKRHAVLAMNLQGGGGFEIWQYTERTPQLPEFDIQLGDLGIFITKIKCKNANQTYSIFKEKGLNVLGEVKKNPAGEDHFFVKDPYNNIFQLEESKEWFKDEGKPTGTVYGAVIGVTDIEKARKLYSDLLGYDKVVYDEKGQFDEFASLPGGNGAFRRVRLAQSKPRVGSFSKLFGEAYIELVKVEDREPKKIFEGRLWGDRGFIHLCFDIRGMNDLRKECEEKGFPFTVDSANAFEKGFDMGEAAGHFSYIEDPDGTLIEFVETHKVPLMKKLGIYLNMKKRAPEKPVPNWIIKGMKLHRYKG